MTQPPAERTFRPSSAYVFAFGVLLPVITLLVELFTRMSAGGFFDPIPTPWHALLIAIVPLANLVVLLATTRPTLRHRPFLGWLNAVAIGISLCYALLFLPFAPIGVIGIIFFGLGFLPLSPLLSFVATLIARAYVREYARPHAPERVPHFWTGLGSAALMLSLASAPMFLTDVGLRMAGSHSADTNRNGVALLRAVGGEERLVRMYRQQVNGDGWFTPTLWGTNLSPEALRSVYYRVTGDSIDDAPRPSRDRKGVFDFMPGDETFDADRGGTRVGQHRPGLFLDSSRIDGTIDPDAALAYMEWTLVFRNDTHVQEEARTQIALPAGGVVSRLTLWINDEPREAAFGKRAQVRGAYESVVRQKRDPVLVTTTGPDRVLVQCFPVPSRGNMKIRVGITAPLQLATLEHGSLLLPALLDSNFVVSADHSVWFDSARDLSDSTGLLKRESTPDGRHVLRGELPVAQLDTAPPSVIATRSAPATVAWTRDPLEGSNEFIVQRIRVNPAPLKRLVLVIDGSRRIGSYAQQIADALAAISTNTEISVLVASDEVIDIGNGAHLATATYVESLQHAIRRTRFRGGADNVPALTRAWDIANESSDAVILWLHAPQAELLSRVTSLLQRWDRSPGRPLLLSIQLAPGTDRVLEALDGVREITQPLPPATALRNLTSLVASITSSQRIDIVRDKSEVSPSEAGATATSGHLARLWAHEQSMKLNRSPKPNGVNEAAAVATSYQLVTPVTGAVVLETAQQYQVAGLKPVDAKSVPSVPEPGSISLLIGGAVLLMRRPRRFSPASGR